MTKEDKGWSSLWTLVVLLIYLIIAYNAKWFPFGLSNIQRKYCGGGLIQRNSYINPVVGVTPVSYEQGGFANAGCGVTPLTTSSGIPIEIVPTRR